MSVHHKLTVKTTVVKPLAHCKLNVWVIFTGSLSPHQMKCICTDFKGLSNGRNFILIDHCVGELLSINEVPS